jgi:FMN-dependent NADH-azoreductase
MKILVVDSSPRGRVSRTHQLTAEIVERLRKRHPGASVRRRDLAAEPLPHLGEAHLNAFVTAPEARSEAERELARPSDEAVAELLEADALVIGLPIYNFSVPSGLKSWIDHVARAGLTFRYTAAGPEGLVKGKKVYLAISSGGIYTQGAMKALDFTEPYLRAVLGFLGMTDVSVVRAEGTALPGVQESAYASAVEAISV